MTGEDQPAVLVIDLAPGELCYLAGGLDHPLFRSRVAGRIRHERELLLEDAFAEDRGEQLQLSVCGVIRGTTQGQDRPSPASRFSGLPAARALAKLPRNEVRMAGASFLVVNLALCLTIFFLSSFFLTGASIGVPRAREEVKKHEDEMEVLAKDLKVVSTLASPA